MLNRLYKSALCAVALVAAGWAQQPPKVSEIAARVDHAYNNLRSLKADFAESYRAAGLVRAESGTLWLKQPGQMRWEYRAPSAKVFVSDGKTAWFYVPGERQARRASVKKLDDLRTPLRYLLGHTKLEKEFNGLSLAPDVRPTTDGNVVLRGIPKGMEDRVSQVLLEITPASEIVRLVIEETDGATTEFRFANLQPNVAIADTQFRFTPPAGVEVVEAKDLTPQ